MNGKSLTLALIATMLSLPAFSQTESLSATFSWGMPKDFKTVNLDGMTVAQQYFNNAVMPSEVWYMCNEKGIGEETCEYVDPEVRNPAAGAKYGLLSCSRRSDATKSTDNWLILPQLKVSNGFGLRWGARSIHFKFRETYKIMVSTSNDDPSSFKEVFRIEDESYLWKEHYLDLSDYAGRNIYVAIVHCSTNKYLLALDYVEAGVFSDTHFSVENTGRHYFGASDGLSLHFKVSNHGADADVSHFEVRNADDGTLLGSVPAGYGIFRKGSSRDVSVSLTDYFGSCFYNLVAICNDGSEHVIYNDFVNKSNFARKMYVMKMTGTWCNSCPKVGYASHIVQEQLGDECIFAEIHQDGSGVDKDGYTDFINEYTYTVRGDYPAMWYNLSHAKDTYRYRDYSGFKKAVLTPCVADVNIKKAQIIDNKLHVKATVRFANDTDNGNDRYRLGIIFADKEVVPHPASTDQQWQSPGSSAAYGEYFFMPSSFPKEINPLEHVVRTPIEGAKGIPSSLPSEIIGMKEYDIEFDTDFTDTFRADEIIAIANVIDSESKSYEVLNSDMADVSGVPAPEFVLVSTLNEITEGNAAKVYAYGLRVGELIQWHSSDENVATIDNNGMIRAIKKGTAVISATTDAGRKAECAITVKSTNAVDSAVAEGINISRLGDQVTINVHDENCVISVFGLGGELKRFISGVCETTLTLPEISIIRVISNGMTYTRKI